MKILFSIFILTFALTSATFAQTQTDHDKGIELYQEGEYEKALDVLKIVVANDKKDRIAWLFLGASAYKLNDRLQAVSFFIKADKISYKLAIPFEKDAKIISQSPAPYTDIARTEEVTGVVKLAVELGADGKIGFVLPIQTLPHGLTENSVATAKKIKFEPATNGGKAISTIKVVEYSFDLY